MIRKQFQQQVPLFSILLLSSQVHAGIDPQADNKILTQDKTLHAVKLDAQSPQSQRDCSADDWVTIDNFGNLTGAKYNSANEVGLLDGGNEVTYGYVNQHSQQVGFRECELKAENVVKVPVFMVDWEDFDPATDMSNPNNPGSVQGEDYKQLTPEEVRTYLTSSLSPAQYFSDVSGGKLNIEFEVIGWLKSEDEGSHIKLREEYLYQSEHDGRWYCDRNQVMKDVLKEAVLNHGLNPDDYDINQGERGQEEGLMNGAVLLYEGGPGSCSGYNMSWIEIGSFEPGELVEEAALDAFNFNELIAENTSDQDKLNNINKVLRVYNNIPEISIDWGDTFGWVHELGHMFLGFPDYYYNQFNMGNFALSATSPNNDAFHPAGFEKWLFAKWIEPVELSNAQNIELVSHDIADNSEYDNSLPYLYKHHINGDPQHYLLIENRWLENAGNTLSSWVKQRDTNFGGGSLLESGMQIIEINLKNDYFGDDASVYRHTKPGSDSHDSTFESWADGDEFYQCFGTYCVEISAISNPKQTMTFDFRAGNDSDGDGVFDEDDAFPNDPNEWLDTDGDGIGNNADPDDDNDGVLDEEDAFPLDSSEWLDTDGDGIGNNADPDDDNDGVDDEDDAFPLDSSEWLDTDGDGIGNNADPDDDNDGFSDNEDAFPLDSTEWLDTDSDGIGNNADPDDDNDGFNDGEDAFPFDSTEWLDTDGDGIGNNADPDDDNDGVPDVSDAFPLDASLSSNPTPENAEPASSSSGGSFGWLSMLGLLTLIVRRKVK